MSLSICVVCVVPSNLIRRARSQRQRARTLPSGPKCIRDSKSYARTYMAARMQIGVHSEKCFRALLTPDCTRCQHASVRLARISVAKLTNRPTTHARTHSAPRMQMPVRPKLIRMPPVTCARTHAHARARRRRITSSPVCRRCCCCTPGVSRMFYFSHYNVHSYVYLLVCVRKLRLTDARPFEAQLKSHTRGRSPEKK